MEPRRTIPIILKDKKYTFAERNKDDMDFFSMQEKVRKKRFEFIQTNVKDPDNQVALLMTEINKVYSNTEIGMFIGSDPEELKRICYDSFKIENPEVKFEKFIELLDEGQEQTISKMIFELEAEQQLSPEEIAKELSIDKAKLKDWKTTQPELYGFILKRIKKKGEPTSVPK